VAHNRRSRFGGAVHQTQSISDHHVTEGAVIASEIEQLSDLTGFLKVASRAEWRRVAVSHQQQHRIFWCGAVHQSEGPKVT
jgi:hypothetical protein